MKQTSKGIQPRLGNCIKTFNPASADVMIRTAQDWKNDCTRFVKEFSKVCKIVAKQLQKKAGRSLKLWFKNLSYSPEKAAEWLLKACYCIIKGLPKYALLYL